MSIDHKTLDDIAGKIAGSLQMMGGLKQGVESQIRSAVESALSQFDVVTHERMQVQEAMLQKARDELTRLEKRVADLEQQLRQTQGK